MKQRAFTLMELMIVIVIIGILSAVGMVMFGGQSEKAKIAVAKTNHKAMIKILTFEMMKCATGDEKIFDGKLYCSSLTGATLDGYAQYAYMKAGFKNPYDPNARYPSRSSAPWYFGPWTDADVGYVNHNTLYQSKDLYIQTCVKIPCTDSKNILSNTLTPE